MTDTDLLFPITLTLQAAFSSLVLFAVIGVPLALYTARSKTRLSRAVLFIAGLPLVIQPVKEAFESKTLLDLECAARVCGATPMTTFLRVTLPTVRNAVLSAFLLGTARASGEVGITMMLGGNVSDKTNTLSLEIYNAVGRGDFDTATALCAVLAAVALVLYAALELLRRRSDV